MMRPLQTDSDFWRAHAFLREVVPAGFRRFGRGTRPGFLPRRRLRRARRPARLG